MTDLEISAKERALDGCEYSVPWLPISTPLIMFRPEPLGRNIILSFSDSAVALPLVRQLLESALPPSQPATHDGSSHRNSDDPDRNSTTYLTLPPT